jgi:hypothetical protein
MKAYADAIRYQRRRTRRGTSCPPTTNGSRDLSSPRRSSRDRAARLRFPTIDAAVEKEFAECRKWLLAEKD